MRTLISEYGPGGSKIGNGPGQRHIQVIFIFMTGHAENNNNVGGGNFYEEWENTHTLGIDWYENRNYPTNVNGSSVSYGVHNTHI